MNDGETGALGEVLTLEEKYAEILGPLLHKHGGRKKVTIWDVPDFGLVVAAKPPNAGNELARFRQLVGAEGVDPMPAIVQLALKCIVHPDQETARKIFDELPLFPTEVAKAGQRHCGLGMKELGKG